MCSGFKYALGMGVVWNSVHQAFIGPDLYTLLPTKTSQFGIHFQGGSEKFLSLSQVASTTWVKGFPDQKDFLSAFAQFAFLSWVNFLWFVVVSLLMGPSGAMVVHWDIIY